MACSAADSPSYVVGNLMWALGIHKNIFLACDNIASDVVFPSAFTSMDMDPSGRSWDKLLTIDL
jgi:hypothetical protein